MRKATIVSPTEEEIKILEGWVNNPKTERRLCERAKIILAAAEGQTTKHIANNLNTRPTRISKWRTRFAQDGLKGLQDAYRSGKPKKYDKNTERRILKTLEESPPEGYITWTGELVAKQLDNVDKYAVWRILKKHNIDLQQRKSWCISTDPEFTQKAADIVGLYLEPPENAVVLSVDEKPAIQALERAQGWLRLPNGKALTGFNHEYKRHGTTTLFAALEIATGLIQTSHYKRRRRREFLDFMNEIIALYPNQEIHVILDNLNTHKPKNDRWLSRHKNVHFHYTPTRASWLNQIEIWFSILTRTVVRKGSFTSTRHLRMVIDKFVKAYNKKAAPFEWTKKKVFSTSPKLNIANFCK